MAGKSTYTSEMGETICGHIAEGLSLDKIAKLPGMPSKVTIIHWTNTIPEFDVRYDEAKEAEAEVDVDSIRYHNAKMIEISETEPDPKRANVRVHAHQNVVQNIVRLAQSRRRRKYGDKVQAEISGKDGGPLVFQVERIGRK